MAQSGSKYFLASMVLLVALVGIILFRLPSIFFSSEIRQKVSKYWKEYRESLVPWSTACEGQIANLLVPLTDLEGPANRLGGLPNDLCSEKAESYGLMYSLVRDSLHPFFNKILDATHKPNTVISKQAPIDPKPWQQVKGNWKFPWYAEVLYLHFEGRTDKAAKELISLLSVAAYMDQCPIFVNKSVTRPMYRDCARLALFMLPSLSEKSIQALSDGLRKGVSSFSLFDIALVNHFLLVEQTQVKTGTGPLAKMEQMLFRAEAVSAIETSRGNPEPEIAEAAIRARKFLEAIGRHPLPPIFQIKYQKRYERIEGLVKTVLSAMDQELERRSKKAETILTTQDGKKIVVDNNQGCIRTFP